MTGASKATKGFGELEWQALGLLTDIRGCVTHIFHRPAMKEQFSPTASRGWFLLCSSFLQFYLSHGLPVQHCL